MNGTATEIEVILILLGGIALLVGGLVMFITRPWTTSPTKSLEERERQQAKREPQRAKQYSKELFSPDEEEWFIQKFASNIKLVSWGYVTIEAVYLIERHYKWIESLTKDEASIVKKLKFVSVRARVAWCMMCLESVIQKLDAYNEAWVMLLPRLWGFTQVGDCKQSSLWEQVSYFNKYLPIYLKRGAKDWQPTPAEQQVFLNSAPTHPFLQTILREMDEIGYEEFTDHCHVTASDDHIVEIIEVMHQLQLPLPSVEPFWQYECKDFAFGTAFDGTQYSIYVKKQN